MPTTATPPEVAASSHSSSEPELVQRIVAALEDERFDFRTINGIATELAIPEDQVVSILNSMPTVVVRTADANGRSLFTTRTHYDKTHGFGDKLLSALADKVVA